MGQATPSGIPLPLASLAGELANAPASGLPSEAYPILACYEVAA